MRYADLHVHTTASDGTLTPTQVVELAAERNLAAIAITDHDTVAGVAEAQRAGESRGIAVLSGIEISTAWRGTEIHLLGYLIDPTSEALRPALEWTVADRDRRNEAIVEKLQRDGYRISIDRLRRISGGVIGRPHMAQVLMEEGQVSSISEAFEKLLGEGKPYFLPRTYIPLQQAVELIRQAGGVPVLAHPLQYGFDADTLKELVGEGRHWGIAGMEVYYSGYSQEDIARLTDLANHWEMLLTGGSDFHGSRKPHIDLGRGTGDLFVPETVVKALKLSQMTQLEVLRK